MLHILLLILKIIGIILAVLLGIIIVLAAIVMFVPFRYEISAKCDGDIESLKAKVKATWLLHLIRADVFLKGKKLKWTVRLAWIKKSNTVISKGPEEKKKDEPEKPKVQKVEEDVIRGNEPEKGSEHIEEEPKSNCEMHQENIGSDQTGAGSSDDEFSGNNKKESLRDKLNKIIDKIKDLLEKKDKLTGFVTEQSHVKAFRKAKKVLFKLLKQLKPKKVQGKVKFGFDDPATTGKVLGGLSMFYPLFGDSLDIIPDFENQILKGTVYVKGKIRICHFVSLAVKMILCKDVRITYRDIRNFKL